MWLRIIATLIFAQFLGAHLSVADDADVPCGKLAEYLKTFAREHPDKAMDSGSGEFLFESAHIHDDRSDPAAPVSALPPQSFDRLSSAVAGIHHAELTEDGRQLLEDGNVTEDSGWTTIVYDLRPYNNVVVISQVQGTMHCEQFGIFTVEYGKLKPRSKPSDTEEEGMCWTSGLAAIRIGESAYPAVISEDEGPRSIGYDIGLLRTDASTICSVSIGFNPNVAIATWLPSRDADPALLRQIRSFIESNLTKTEDVQSWPEPAADPNDTSAYGDYLRVQDRDDQDVRWALDPDGILSEVPNAQDESYTDIHGATPQPIELDAHRLIIEVVQPSLGWRTLPDEAFGVWEWRDGKLWPIVGGYMGKRADKPVITQP